MMRTSDAHLSGSATDSRFQLDRRRDFEVTPVGNSVDLEEEMIKVAANQMDYQAATQLYTRGLDLIKVAIGKK
jgi:flagellar basal-body rod protein FlgB